MDELVLALLATREHRACQQPARRLRLRGRAWPEDERLTLAGGYSAAVIGLRRTW